MGIFTTIIYLVVIDEPTLSREARKLEDEYQRTQQRPLYTVNDTSQVESFRDGYSRSAFLRQPK